MPKSKESSVTRDIIYGGIVGSAIFVILTAVVCAVLLKIDLSRDFYLPILMLILGSSGIASGYACVRRRREKGLINGVLASIIPSVIVLIAMTAAYKGFSVFELIVIACCAFGGAVGGIGALNIKKKRKYINKDKRKSK